MTRQTKTPAQRAQEQYDVAVRAADRLNVKAQAALDTYEALVRERDAAFARRNYLANHPDLPTQTSPATNPSGDNPS